MFCFEEYKRCGRRGVFRNKRSDCRDLTEEETETAGRQRKAITDIAVDPYYVLMGFAARAAADNTIAYPTVTPAAYAKTDSRFTVIRPEKFTLNGNMNSVRGFSTLGKHMKNKITTTKVTAFWTDRTIKSGRWAKRSAAGNAQLQDTYKNSGILHTARITDGSGKGKFGAWYGMSRYL